MTLVIDNIAELITNVPDLGEGPLGIVENASVVVDGGKVVAIGPAGASADQRLDAGGRCVLPGFVDSHTHLVFAGDRAEEFTRRMAGEPYDGGGIRITTEATRAAGPPGPENVRSMGGSPRCTGRARQQWRSSRATGYRSNPKHWPPPLQPR